jgi:hypothetical protein
MTEQRLQELLEQLHSEIERTESVDEKGRGLLRDLKTDIAKLLERSGESDASTLKRFQETIDHFEADHPTLTLALSEALTILSNAGI